MGYDYEVLGVIMDHPVEREATTILEFKVLAPEEGEHIRLNEVGVQQLCKGIR